MSDPYDAFSDDDDPSPDPGEYCLDGSDGICDEHGILLVLDEIQYLPQLLAYIKTRIDEQRRPGFWVMTGSQNFQAPLGL